MAMRSISLIFVVLLLPYCKVKDSPSTGGDQIEKPNFIIILTDDQGYNDLGCYGSPLIKTPNIDQMAKEGIRFTNFYAQPICGPSRTAFMTGCYPLRVAEIGNVKRMHPMVHPKEVLLPEVLKEAGYTSGCIGKWDLNGHGQGFQRDDIYPRAMGFNYWFGLPSSNDGGVRDVYRNEELVNEKITVDTLTQLYTSEALQFIEREKNGPFFLYIAHTMPHTKLGASQKFRGKSNFGLYGDVIEELDWSVGQIRQKLIELDLDSNTILVFTSDNGPWRARGTHGGSAFPFRSGKATTWEGGVRVPCIVWGGKYTKSGIVNDRVVTSMDWLPTFAKLGGAKLPEGITIDGKDITSLIVQGAEEEVLEQTYYYYIETHLQAVRQDEWKLVLPRPQAAIGMTNSKKSVYRREDMEAVKDLELYNLKSDPSERRDVAAFNPDIVQKMLKLVAKARADIGDYNVIGEGARFYDQGEKRPDVKLWKEISMDSIRKSQKIHPFYDDGGRIL